ncbi:hypothetical protein SAMN04489712_101504 [Thermomonospora echinospora]|uniref:DUF1579 domain-containing protein n=1 Tax=Thermomonospora echinospora TaxID=1992 RepID=A0A1H5T6L8_9ACTN|nr:hypothetical protein [Thermomonospora echinospora]SEF58473.1 hypothetical protein SAMN04489712_101504 [Thermomonospora echinospora]
MHPSLEQLAPLIGRWSVQPKVPGLGAAWTEFAWHEGGLFLRQYSDVEEIPPDAPQEWREHAPFPTTALIGLDDAAGGFTMLYADARGVHRVYRMTFDGRVWTIRRDAPGFDQRFTGTLNGDTIDGRWEIRTDGEDWRLDFEVAYARLR